MVTENACRIRIVGTLDAFGQISRFVRKKVEELFTMILFLVLKPTILKVLQLWIGFLVVKLDQLYLMVI